MNQEKKAEKKNLEGHPEYFGILETIVNYCFWNWSRKLIWEERKVCDGIATPRLLFSPNLAGTARGGNREKKRKGEMLQQLLSKFQYFSIISVYFSQNRQSGEIEEKRNTAATFQ